MDLVLFGIQGSGKGTQAKRLAAEFGYDILEMGAELRKIIASGSELGKTVSSYIDKGNHAPLEIVMQVVKDAVLSKPKDQKILFDGIPRNLDQMHSFDQIMQEVGRSFRCIHLTIPREVSLERIMNRATQEGRIDDAATEIINRRIDLFFEKTMPVIEDYQQKGSMTEVDGMASVEEVYARMKSAIV